MASLTWVLSRDLATEVGSMRAVWSPGGEDVFAKMRKLIQELASGS